MTATSKGVPALGGWNYRVFFRQIPTDEGDTEPEFFIGEAYYSEDDGSVVAWSGPVEVIGEDTAESVRDELRKMWNALDKPPLDYDAEPPARRPRTGGSTRSASPATGTSEDSAVSTP